MDFKNALLGGFEAAEASRRARNEIASILQKLQKDVLEATGGVLSLEIEEFDLPSNPFQILSGEHMVASILGKRIEKKTYRALVARHKTVQMPLKEMATWKQSDSGYPCILTWGGQERQCEDAGALVSALADFLRDPNIGGILHALVQMKPQAVCGAPETEGQKGSDGK